MAPAVHTWTGMASALWSNNDNWQGGAPASGEQDVQLIFGTDAAINRATNNDLANLNITSITFRTDGYTLGGTALTLVNNATVRTEGAAALTAAINLNMVLAGSTTINVGAAGSVITLGGVLSGTGGLTKVGPGRLDLAGATANTYTGTTLVNEGTLLLTKTAGVNAVVGPLTVGDGTGGADADVVRLGAANQIADGVTVTGSTSGRFDLNGLAETIGALAGAGSVTLGAATLTVGQITGTTTFTGVLSGTGGLTKAAASIQVLGGVNTYTGATNVTGGTLRLGVANALAAASAVTVAAATTLDLNNNNLGLNTLAGSGSVTLGSGTLTLGLGNAAGNFTGVISGTGGLTKTGTGVLTLGGVNTYTGATTVNAGTLRQGVVNALAAATAVTVDAGGTFDLNNLAVAIASLAGGGNVTLGSATLTVGSASGTTTFTGVISGTGGLTKVAASIQVLGGVNTYTGATAVNAGTLRMGVANALAAASAVTVASMATLDLNNNNLGLNTLAGAGSVTLGSGTLTLGLNNAASNFTGVLSGTGGLTKAGTGIVTLGGVHTYTGATTVNAGTLRLGGANALAAATAVTVAMGATFDLNNLAVAIASLAGAGNVTLGSATLTVGSASDTTTFTGVLSGTGGLTKVAASIQVLGGASTYTGPTNVNGGTLRLGVANALAAATLVTVASGATLDLNNNNLSLNTLAGAGTVTLGSATLTVGLNNTTGAFNGVVSGTGGLTKAGTGTFTLGGVNTYTGATTVNGGSLTLGVANALANVTAVTVGMGATLNLNNNAAAVGSLAGAGNVTLGSATLTVGQNNTAANFTGVLSGTGGLTKVGTAAQTLGGVNTYTGPTTVNGGTLQMGVANALANATAVTVGMGAALNLANNALAIASLAGAGNVTLGSGTLTTGGGNTATTFSGVVSGTGGLTKAGTGVFTLSGANMYTGATTVSAGTLAAGAANALPSATAVTVASGATLSLNTFSIQVGSLAGAGLVNLGTATLTAGDAANTTFGGTILGTGGLAKVGTGTLTLGGSNSYLGATAVNAGTLQVGGASALPSGTALTVAAGATLNLANNPTTVGSLAGAGNVTLGSATLNVGGNNLATSFTGIISGAGGLAKAGSGTLTLGGNNTYTGDTVVNGGTLLVNGMHAAASAVTVGTAGILGGTGTVGDVTVAGAVAPGVGAGTLRARNVRFLAGSSYRAEVNGTTAGTNHDQLNLTGSLNLSDGPDLNVTLGYAAQQNDRIVLAVAANPVQGTFRNLANGAALTVGGFTFRVNYNDNGNNVVLTRTQIDTTTNLVTSGSPSIFGQQVRFTATVAAASGTPTGAVTFRDGMTTLGTVNLTDGRAEFATTTLSVATHTITAEYGGDANFRPSTSAAVTQVVNRAVTAVALASSANPSAVGQEVTFTATITVTAPGAGSPTGQVTFFDGATSLGTAAVTNGQAVFRVSTLTNGPHAITAEYGGDANFLSGRSAALTQNVSNMSTTVTLTSSAANAVFGQAVTFTATVTATGGGTPTGRVTFRDGDALLGTADLQTGRATFTTSTLSVASHNIRASYDGDATFSPSTATPLTQVVSQAATTVVITLADNTSVFGQATLLTATVNVTAPGAGNPTGSVTFRDGDTVLGTATLSGNRATLNTSALAVGLRTLTAEFAGDTNFARGTSPAVTQTVTKARTSITLTTSSPTVAVDADVTFTATVTVVAPGGGALQGEVVFKDGATILGRGALTRNGVATLTTMGLFGGTHSITAEFAGDANFEQSTSAAVSENVTGTTNQFYVAGLFRTFFKRAPDRSGLTFWVGQLTNGVPRLDVARGFARSAEYAGVQVDQFYQTYLRRPADLVSRDFWVRQFQAGASESDVQRGFVTSAEYRGRTQTDTGFVSGLYQDMFGRQADVGGQSTFTQRLQSGESRDSIALLFLNQPERRGRVVDQVYLDLLGRQSDAAGRQNFVGLLNQGVAVPLTLAEGFAISDEFVRRVTGGVQDPARPAAPPRPPVPPVPPRPPASPPRGAARP